MDKINGIVVLCDASKQSGLLHWTLIIGIITCKYHTYIDKHHPQAAGTLHRFKHVFPGPVSSSADSGHSGDVPSPCLVCDRLHACLLKCDIITLHMF